MSQVNSGIGGRKYRYSLDVDAATFLASLPKPEREFKWAFWNVLRTLTPLTARMVKQLKGLRPCDVRDPKLLDVVEKGRKAIWTEWNTTWKPLGYLTFGKHAGRHVSEVKPDYLGYLLFSSKLEDVYREWIWRQLGEWTANPESVPFEVRMRKVDRKVRIIDDLEDWQLSWYARTYYPGSFLGMYLRLAAAGRGLSLEVPDIEDWDAMDEHYEDKLQAGTPNRTPKPSAWYSGKTTEYDPQRTEERLRADRKRVLYHWDRELRCLRARAPQWTSRYGEYTGELGKDDRGNTYRRHVVIDDAPLRKVQLWESVLAAVDKFDRADDPDLLQMYRDEATDAVQKLGPVSEYQGLLDHIEECYQERSNWLERNGKTKDWYVDWDLEVNTDEDQDDRTVASWYRISNRAARDAALGHWVRELESCRNGDDLLDVAAAIRRRAGELPTTALHELRATYARVREELKS